MRLELPALKEVDKEYPLRYVIVANPESEVNELREAQKTYDFMDFQVRPLPQDELYTYLHASDALLIHRESSQKYKAVVSSSVCQVLGSGCPILFHESNYVGLHGDEIVKYRDFKDMKTKLIDIFGGKFDLKKVKAFIKEHNAENTAKRFVLLFEELIKTRGNKKRKEKREWIENLLKSHFFQNGMLPMGLLSLLN